MNKFMKIVLSLLTLVTFLFLVAGAVWGILVKIPIMFVVCALLSAAFGIFIVRDFKYFFGKK